MMILTGKTVLSALRPPYPYGGEFVSQFLFALKLCWFPLLVSTVAFGYGAPGLQAANFLVLFGALDRLGGLLVLAAIREFAPWGRGDPPGARCGGGVGGGSGQEPGRPAVPRVDAGHGPVRYLCVVVRDFR